MLLNWLLDEEVLREIELPILRVRWLDPQYIDLTPITADPVITSGRLWFRGDVNNIYVGVGSTKMPLKLVGSSFNTGQVSVGTSVTLIKDANSNRLSVILLNMGSTIVYIGPSSKVSSSTGIPLLQNTALALNYTGAIYGISSSGTNVVAYLELML